MYCTNCGEQMNDNQAICLKCGVKVGDGKGYCANCGGTIAENASVCLNCGVAVKGAKSGDLAGQDKIVMALICFFLGGIGIHNFIMGEVKKGVMKIILAVAGSVTLGITTLVCGVLVLIEFVKILTDSYEVDTEKFF